MIACPHCSRPLPDLFREEPRLQPCPHCRTEVRVALFPALLRPPALSSAGEPRVGEGEASCFYHPEKRAVLACAGCGRFLCGLCDLEVNGEHLCSACLASGRRRGRLQNLENRRVRYDALALLLALAPLLIFYLTIFTAPAVVYLVCRHWKGPHSLVQPNRWRMVVALVLALAQIGGWALLGLYLFSFSHAPAR